MGNWVTEAERFEELSERNIFINKPIREFLKTDRIFWVISSKGMGKTLLLRYKRELLEQTRAKTGILILPIDKELDYAFLPAYLPSKSYAVMADSGFWKDLWEISITFSIILNFSLDSFMVDEAAELKKEILELDIPSEIKSEFLNKFKKEPFKKSTPSYILSAFLSSGIPSLQKLRRYSLELICNLYSRYIRRGVYLFIDSFDQALQEKYPYKLDIWVAGQIGLLKASWDISRQNPHIKVYTSIRQEAYSAFKDESRMAMQGSILLIKYIQDELEELFNKSISFFEGKDSIQDLTGLSSTIWNEHARQNEDIFRYIYRHTIGTPRSFMVVGNEIANQLNLKSPIDKRIEQFRQILNISTANEISSDYLLSEMNKFLDGLKEKKDLIRFFSLIKRNILTKNMVIRICMLFNNRNDCDKTCSKCEHSHPFCELYNIGLIGQVEYDFENKKQVQIFRKPYEFNWDMKGIMPDSKHYLIHPSLHSYIHTHNPIYKMEEIVIGDGYDWLEEYNQRLSEELIKVFITYSSEDSEKVNKIVQVIDSCLGEKHMFVDIWLDKWKIRGGEWIQEKIEKGLKESDFLLLMLSKNSLESNWVEIEWRNKFEDEIKNKKVYVFPIVLDKDIKDLPGLLRGKSFREIDIENTSIFERQIEVICDDIIALKRESSIISICKVTAQVIF